MEKVKNALRKIEVSDLAQIVEWYYKNPLSYYYYQEQLPGAFSREQIIFEMASAKCAMYMLGDKKSGAFVALREQNDRAALSLISTDSRQKAELQEGISKLLLQYFKSQAVNYKVSALLLKEEETSREILSALGFAVEGIYKQHILLQGKYRDVYCYGLLREDYF